MYLLLHRLRYLFFHLNESQLLQDVTWSLSLSTPFATHILNRLVMRNSQVPTKICHTYKKMCGNVYYRKVWRLSYITFHIIPSIVARGISWSGDWEESMMALPRMRQRESLPKNWLVTSFSSSPLLLARAVARSFTWAKAPEWKPRKVSRANGKNTSPSCRQASSVSLFFLRQALSSEAPAFAAAPATFDLAKGLVTVTSIAVGPAPDQHITWTRARPWQRMSRLLGWSQVCTCCCLVDDVPQHIMPGNPVTGADTAKSMFAHAVTLSTAGWTETIAGVNWDAQSIFDGWDELWWAEMETQGRRGHNWQPITSMREPQWSHPGDLSFLICLRDKLKKARLVQEIDLETDHLLRDSC